MISNRLRITTSRILITRTQPYASSLTPGRPTTRRRRRHPNTVINTIQSILLRTAARLNRHRRNSIHRPQPRINIRNSRHPTRLIRRQPSRIHSILIIIPTTSISHHHARTRIKLSRLHRLTRLITRNNIQVTHTTLKHTHQQVHTYRFISHPSHLTHIRTRHITNPMRTNSLLLSLNNTPANHTRPRIHSHQSPRGQQKPPRQQLSHPPSHSHTRNHLQNIQLRMTIRPTITSLQSINQTTLMRILTLRIQTT